MTAFEAEMDRSIDVAVVMGVELRPRQLLDTTVDKRGMDMQRTATLGLVQTEQDGDSFFHALKQGAALTMMAATQKGIGVPLLDEIVEKSVVRLRAQFVAFLYVEQNRIVIDRQGRRGILRSVVAMQIREQLQHILNHSLGEPLGILRTCLRHIGRGQFSYMNSLEMLHDWVFGSTTVDEWLVDDYLRTIPQSAEVMFALGMMLLSERYWPIPDGLFRWVAETHGVSLRIFTWDRRLGRRYQDRSIMQEDRSWIYLQKMADPTHYSALFVKSSTTGTVSRALAEDYWLPDDDAIAQFEMDWREYQSNQVADDFQGDGGWQFGEADGWMTYDDLEYTDDSDDEDEYILREAGAI
jgi:hypothetical protein